MTARACGTMLMLCTLGCAAQPEVRLRVSPELMARVPADAPNIAAARARLAQADAAATHARNELAQAEAAARTSAAPEFGAHGDGSPEFAAIVTAHRRRADAGLRWQHALADAARLRSISADAALQLVYAVVLDRVGAELDPEAFRAQASRLADAAAHAQSEVLAAHAAVDAAERALADAKERYAALRRPPALAARADGR